MNKKLVFSQRQLLLSVTVKKTYAVGRSGVGGMGVMAAKTTAKCHVHWDDWGENDQQGTCCMIQLSYNTMRLIRPSPLEIMGMIRMVATVEGKWQSVIILDQQ